MQKKCYDEEIKEIKRSKHWSQQMHLKICNNSDCCSSQFCSNSFVNKWLLYEGMSEKCGRIQKKMYA